MFDKLTSLEQRYRDLCEQLGQPETLGNPKRFQEIAKEQAELKPVVDTFHEWRKLDADLAAARELVGGGDPEMAALATEEVGRLSAAHRALEEKLRRLLLPRDPKEGKNVFVEIRAGTGGDEAALFAAALFRMYCRFAERHGLKAEIASTHETGLGGFKEAILFVQGREAYRLLRHESGVHRVQRVPQTEAQGRIHTSTATVVVLPEVDEVEVAIKDEELRIDVFRSSGPGGQSVNTTDSAVRITHLPTGLVVTCQDEKSQHKNKAKALKILRARLLDLEQSKQQASLSALRRSQIGSGDRSERIRTYNFPQNRVTDHRINFTSHNLQAMLDGDLDELVGTLNTAHDAEVMKL